MPERRTLIVLGSLLGAMAAGSTLLMMLEPTAAEGPRLPRFMPQSLMAFDQGRDPTDRLFQLTPAPTSDRWNAIVIRTSGAERGSAGALNELHQRLGMGDLAYHFTVGNGDGAADGQVEIGPRWEQQRPGYTAMALHHQPGTTGVIDICLIGDWDRAAPTPEQQENLIWLVTELQKRLSIPAERVLLGDGYTSRVGQFFPVASFRKQLLTGGGI